MYHSNLYELLAEQHLRQSLNRHTAKLLFCVTFLHANLGFAADWSWLLTYKDKSTNEMIWDKRFDGLLKQVVPTGDVGAIKLALGGPPDPVVTTEERYIFISACVSHSCMDKGFLWLDLKQQKAVGATYDPIEKLLKMASKKFTPKTLPDHLWKAVKQWAKQHELTIDRSYLNDSKNKKIPLSFTYAAATPANSNQPNSPSFDCGLARSRIEKRICQDAELANADRDLATLYKTIFNGTSHMPGRRQLQSEQAAWIKKRDEGCKASEDKDLGGCLLQSYVERNTGLKNWTPTSEKVNF